MRKVKLRMNQLVDYKGDTDNKYCIIMLLFTNSNIC